MAWSGLQGRTGPPSPPFGALGSAGPWRGQGRKTGTIVPRARLKVWSQGQPGPTSLTACAGAKLQCAAPLWTAGGAVGAAFTGHLRGGEGEGQAPCAWWCLLSSPRELRLLGHPHPHLESSQAASSFHAPAWPQSPCFQACPGLRPGWGFCPHWTPAPGVCASVPGTGWRGQSVRPQQSLL